jgi:probable phosphoglycerate mutase
MLKTVCSILVSEYHRTQQTIEPASKELAIEPKIDSRLNEIDFGTLDGLTNDQIKSQYSDIWLMFNECSKDVRFPQGETCLEAQTRIVTLLAEMDTLGGDIVWVSHGGLIRSLACFVLDLPAYRCFDFHMDPMGLMELEWNTNRRKYMLKCINQRIDL